MDKSQKKKKKKKIAARARHRLRSIYRDAQHLHTGTIAELLFPPHWKLVGNERCGPWYVTRASDLGVSDCNCYFKSTDGHVNTWEFSLKRLNLPFLERLVTQDGGCYVIDSSARKILPDSLSRTIPIWATCMNRFVQKYATATIADNISTSSSRSLDQWDTNLYTPTDVVSAAEHAKINSLIDDRVETLRMSGAIVNPARVVGRLTKPLRVIWMNHKGDILPSNNTFYETEEQNRTSIEKLVQDYFVIVCWNPSEYAECVDIGSSKIDSINSSNPKEINYNNAKKRIQSIKWINEQDGESGYYYTPGAADDMESWSRHLTPTLFWMYQKKILNPKLDDDQVDHLIDELVKQARDHEHDVIHKNMTMMMINGSIGNDRITSQNDIALTKTPTCSFSDRIGELNLWIGSRKSGKPPDCWSSSSGFDAILNVTNQEYPGMNDPMENRLDHCRNNNCHNNNGNTNTTKKFTKHDVYYLQLPVEEGKRDKTQLERWMTVGLVFIIHHLQQGRHVLIHCAQGKDRSVSIALVFVLLACKLQFPLKLRQDFCKWRLSTLLSDDNNITIINENDVQCKTETNNCCYTDTVGGESNNNLVARNSCSYLSSGIPDELVTRLLRSKNGGRELFLTWIHSQIQKDITEDACLADKEKIRIALHLIRQYREVADPTRSSMQKVNRFFMSSDIYRGKQKR